MNWAVTFLVIAGIAAIFGFSSIAGTAAGVAQIPAVLFLVLFVVSVVFGRRIA